VVGQLADLFPTTKTQQVVRNRGQHCGNVELVGYLTNATGPVPLVLDLHIVHVRFGSSSDPTLNDTLHYPNPTDIDRSLNEAVTEKIITQTIIIIQRSITQTIIIIHLILSRLYRLLLVPQTDYIVNLLDFYSYRLIGKLTVFLEIKMRKYSCQGSCFTY
jgi:hypothetical protein